MFIAALFTTAIKWNQPKYPKTHGKTKCGIYIPWSISALKGKKVLAHVTTPINLEYIMLSEVSQSQKVHDSTYIRDLVKFRDRKNGGCQGWGQ